MDSNLKIGRNPQKQINSKMGQIPKLGENQKMDQNSKNGLKSRRKDKNSKMETKCQKILSFWT